MYKAIVKRVKRVQRQEVSFFLIKQFWEEPKNRQVILFIYEKEEFLTLISYMDFLNMGDEKDLEFYLDCVYNNKIWGCCDDLEISEALEQMSYITYLLLNVNADGKNATFAYSRLDAEIQHYVDRIKECLNSKGIRVFRVNIPMIQEIKQDRRTNSSLCYVMYSRLLMSDEFRMPKNIEKITDLPEGERKPVISLWYKSLGDAQKKVFLVGPCIVAGTGNPPGERLGDILYHKVRELGIDQEFEIVFVPLQMDESMKLYNILEYDISAEDLVIIIHYNMPECELDLTPLYNSWEGEKWLYQDKPIHTTVTGNELIANTIIEKIVKLVVGRGGGISSIGVWRGEPQFSPTLEFEIRRYISKVKELYEFPEASIIGSIVMNCNPFTYGHRYLIEYAASRVDYLYVFVVEEDLSVFPFQERYNLIREGTKDISNVVLVPSGKFIISRVTFFSYFKKDMYSDHVNLEEDVYIFARYIAEGLRIAKRFVGEEPFDVVTNRYNQKMKEVFPKYGIELIEIPRMGNDNGEVISASQVRLLLEDGKWQKIRKFVPLSTFEYLKQNQKLILRRARKKKLSGVSDERGVRQLVDLICNVEKIIIYSIGEDTETLLKSIPEKIQKRLEYADKMAEDKTIYFHGKLVAPPEDLLNTYRDYAIVVPTVKYGPEIYRMFKQMGIESSRCTFNIKRL